LKLGILTEILKFKPDIIHVVEHTPASMLCGILAKSLDIPLICSSHTHLDSYIPLFINKFATKLSLKVYRFVRKHFLNMANCNLTVSSDFLQLLKNSGIKSNIHVWKTGVDSQLFNPIYRSHEIRLKMFNGYYSDDKILLVSVGRISPEKNFEFLLKIIEKFPQTFLCIVGDGPYREQIEKIFPKDRTNFIGFLQGEELASVYASADYFIYASVSETFGQVYLEAMSSGVPVVAAEGKQMKEFFINGIHGYTWIPDDVDSACKAIGKTIENHEKLSKNCRSNALKHSWDGSAEQIISLYSQFSGYVQNRNIFKTLLRSFWYFLNWLFLMVLCLLFMAPFVTRPITTNRGSVNCATGSKQNECNKSRRRNESTKLLFLQKFYKDFIIKKIYDESNRICGAFLATLSAIFLSLIFTTIYVMVNGKLSIGYFFS
jgi:glycosyltransferase involved in cell wall biosynthesis